MDKRLLLSILDYLDGVKNQSNNSSLTEEAIRLLQWHLASYFTSRMSFNMDRTDAQTRTQYGVTDSLSSIFNSVRLLLCFNLKYLESHKKAGDHSELSPELQSFVSKLEQRGYFQSYSPDSAEYKVFICMFFIECRICCRRRSISTCTARTASKRSVPLRTTSMRASRSRRKETSISALGTSTRRSNATRKR